MAQVRKASELDSCSARSGQSSTVLGQHRDVGWLPVNLFAGILVELPLFDIVADQERVSK